MTEPPGAVQFTADPAGPLVVMSGEIDYAVVMRVMDSGSMEDVTTAGDLRVDLSAVTFMDSLGISLLLRFLHLVAGEVRLVDTPPPPDIKRLLLATGLGTVLTFD